MTHVSKRPIGGLSFLKAILTVVGGGIILIPVGVVAAIFTTIGSIFLAIFLSGATLTQAAVMLWGLLCLGVPVVLTVLTEDEPEIHRLTALGSLGFLSALTLWDLGVWMLVPFGIAVLMGGLEEEERIDIRWLYFAQAGLIVYGLYGLLTTLPAVH